MPESEELFNEIAQIKDELEEQGSMIDALVRANSRNIETEILSEFQRDPALGEILLLVDGTTPQTEIQQTLKSRGVKGSSIGAVSNKIDKLANDLHLIEFARRETSGTIYRRTRLEQVLKIAREWERRRSES